MVVEAGKMLLNKREQDRNSDHAVTVAGVSPTIFVRTVVWLLHAEELPPTTS